MSYCDHSEVGMLLGLSFDSDTKPTDLKVTNVIALIASELNLVLKSVSISLPVIGSDLYNVIKLKNMQGAAGVVGVTYYGNTEDIAGSQGAFYKEEYMNFIADLKANPDVYKDSVKVGFIGNQVTNGTVSEENISDVMIGDDWTD